MRNVIHNNFVFVVDRKAFFRIIFVVFVLVKFDGFHHAYNIYAEITNILYITLA